MEIEKKYDLSEFPGKLKLLEREEMEQGYLCTAPVVRIRSVLQGDKEKYELCFKGKGTLVREEIEMLISKETFLRLKNLLHGEMIRKERRTYLLPDGHHLECNRVDANTQYEFWYAEVEFNSVEEAESFVPPKCVGMDITEKKGASMSAYWEKTRMK